MPTPTALDVIQGALRKIGQYAPGETLSAEDANTALDMLNGLVDLWSNEHLAVYNNVENVLQWVAGKGTYTVGQGGDFNIARPLRITTIYSRLTTSGSMVDFPCDMVSDAKYTAIGLKNQPGPWPKMAYYDSAYPLAQLYVWPVPTASYEMHMWTDQLFTDFANLNSPISLPQGYYLALQYNLAELLIPEYGDVNQVTAAQVSKLAREMKARLKSTNASPTREAFLDVAAFNSGVVNDAGWILTGGF